MECCPPFQLACHCWNAAGFTLHRYPGASWQQPGEKLTLLNLENYLEKV